MALRGVTYDFMMRLLMLPKLALNKMIRLACSYSVSQSTNSILSKLIDGAFRQTRPVDHLADSRHVMR